MATNIMSMGQSLDFKGVSDILNAILKNPIINPVTEDPATGVVGQIIFNATEGALKVYINDTENFKAIATFESISKYVSEDTELTANTSVEILHNLGTEDFAFSIVDVDTKQVLNSTAVNMIIVDSNSFTLTSTSTITVRVVVTG